MSLVRIRPARTPKIFFSEKEIEMSSVRRKKPEKPSVSKQKHPTNHPQITFKINRKLTSISAEKRRQYVKNLDEMLKAFSCLAHTKVYLLWKEPSNCISSLFF